MFALRRASRAYPGFARIRGNATIQSTPGQDVESPPSPPPAPAKAEAKPAEPAKPNETAASTSQVDAKPEEAKVTMKGRRRFWPRKRPYITLERPRQYSRPIGVGVLPAYDEALKYIKWDSRLRKAELEEYRTLLQRAENTPGWNGDIYRLKEKIKILEIQSEINLPSVRWKAKNGLADISKTVYRHLSEQRWRDEGALDLLMERVYQMNVVPDMLPELHPSFDLRVNFAEPPPENPVLRSRQKRKYEKIEPGVFLLPEQTRKPPLMYTTVFHPEPRLYTMLMVDLDVPDVENHTFQAYLHWLQPNVSLSVFSPSPIPLTTTHTKYIPPHPQKGTPYHRYVLLFVPQRHPTERINIPVPTEEERLGFNYREFAREYRLDASKGGAAFMWREVWDETVSSIYRDILKKEEPVYGRMPEPDPYAEIKQAKKYE